MPNGEASMVFNLRDDWMRIYDPDDLNRYQVYGQAVLSGARTKSFVIDTVQEERVFGIQFQPGGTFPFSVFPPRKWKTRRLTYCAYGEGPAMSYGSGCWLRRPSLTCFFSAKSFCYYNWSAPSACIAPWPLRNNNSAATRIGSVWDQWLQT
jgi:hypothetical protein